MRFDDKDISSIGDLLTKLKEDLRGLSIPVWYRGQANQNWKLIPKLLRSENRPPESHYINKFKQDATFILNHKPYSEFEWLFLMQHYGVPTRLLDWSESPLVALYFALFDDLNENGSLWVLLPTELNKISNYKSEFAAEIPSFEDEQLINYLPSRIASERKTSLIPIAAIAPRNSPRMQSQQGVFTISHRDNNSVQDAGPEGLNKNHIWRYNIPGKIKKELLDDLSIIGISKFQLFPELESLSEKFKYV